ncbi:glycosyl transferase [bacterium]|nr:glycosyl transferase [Chloroflexi bacterium CFX6]RIL09143.1 MAG: glycosyl transferase [bacterium]
MPAPTPAPHPPTLYLAVTTHGYGHATRLASIAACVRAARPDVRLIFATTAPRWLLEAYVPGDFEIRPVALDVGVVQPDSLTNDLPATLAALERYRSDAPRVVAEEAAFARAAGVDLVVGDIPPLAPRIARAAGVPGWMVSNFAWDFIYRAWGGPFAEVADWIAACHAACDRLFRPPLCEPTASFPHVTPVGLTGGTPRWPAAAVRARWGLTAPRARIALVTFGGLGLASLPYGRLAAHPEWQFVTWDRAAPDLPNLVRVDDPCWRPVDLMPVAGRMFGKPGFSTFSEALREGVPIVSLPRPGFVEAEILLDGVRDHARHRILPAGDLTAEVWDRVVAPLDPPRTAVRLPMNGSAEVARAIADQIAVGRDARAAPPGSPR